MKNTLYPHHNALIVGICVISLSACTTDWKNEGIYFQTTQTQLAVETKPVGKFYLNSNYVGDPPLNTTLEYGREILRKTRKVSYWRTQPGLTLLISLVSLGVYLPFSAIPVDIETSLEPTGNFKGNRFQIKLELEGQVTFEDEIICTGQDKFLYKKSFQ